MKAGVLLFMVMSSGIGTDNWKLQKEAEGISIYTKPVQGTDYSMFRGVTRVKTSLNSLVSIWSSPDKFTEWMHTCKFASLLEKETEQTYIIYIVSTVPWPLPNRDNILRSALTQDKKTGKVTIVLTGLPDYIEKKDKLFRVPDSFGRVELTPLGNQEVEVAFEFYMNPGGYIPAPIVNFFLLDFPFYTLKKMRNEVQKEVFQAASFRFIQEY